MTASEDVFAVIVTHRDVARAGRCAASTGLPADRIVVVANIPDSGVVTPWAVISPSAPQGYAANVNLGASTAPPGTRWLLLANDDVVFEPRTVERLVAAGEAAPTVGAIAPALYGEDREPQVVAFRHPTIAGELAGVLSGPDVLRRALRRGHSVVASGTGLTTEDWVLGAAVLVRRAAFVDVGGFDERYFMYSEDTQFGLDLGRAGWRSAVLHDARALHMGAMSTSDPRWRDVLAASRRQYLRRNWSRAKLASMYGAWILAQVWNVAYGVAIRTGGPDRRAARAAHARAQRRARPWR